MANEYVSIPKEKFAFTNAGDRIHDEKLKTKARGYFADAFLRFRKNKSSVVAACIILVLVLFAIFAPLLSSFDVNDKDNVFVNFPPFIEDIADMNLGILDGSKVLESQNDKQMLMFEALRQESGYNPVIEVPEVQTYTIIERGKEVVKTSYINVKVNAYYAKGFKFLNVSKEEYLAIQKWQDETGIQVIYPMVLMEDVFPSTVNTKDLTEDPNVWYKCSDSKWTPDVGYTVEGAVKFKPAYLTDASKASSTEYKSQRIAGDEGDYVYAIDKGSAIRIRVFYYNYYEFANGQKANFIFGTDAYGRDLFCAIGMGARFSLIFAVIVSAVNLTLGAIYGAIQGYYGGWVDMILDRISDILSGMPFMVVIALFQYHLAPKMGQAGPLFAFFLAFIATGWIGMAALTRKQFYRFKNSEYVMAARTLGASDKRLMFKHIFPNSLGTMVTSCVLVIPGVISSETSLTYLKIINLAQFTGTSVGELMSLGQSAATTSPHAMLFPALFVGLLLISFNLFGNGLRDAFNPSTRGAE